MLLQNGFRRLRVSDRLGGLVMALLLTGLLNGCGSGSNGGPVYPVATQTRLLQAGDTWVYAVSETSDGNTTRSHLKVTLRAAMLNGSPVLQETSTQDTTDGPFTTVRQLVQDATTRVVSTVGEREIIPPQADTSVPTTYLPGSWSVNTAFTTDTDTLQVAAIERVGTSNGTFNAYKTTVQGRVTVGNEYDAETRWYAPQLGTYVRLESSSFCTVCGVKQYKSVYTLESTTVPLQ